MDFYVNSNKVDITLESEKTLGDVFKSFEIYCEENNAAVIGITVDDKIVTAELFDEISKKEINDSKKIEFTVITKDNILESFKNLSKLFTELAENIKEVPVLLQTGKEAIAHSSIKTLADNIDEFCHIASLASLFQDYNSIKIDEKPFVEFFADFTPILTDFEEALKNNDTVTIGDLSEYEIYPRLISISAALSNIK